MKRTLPTTITTLRGERVTVEPIIYLVMCTKEREYDPDTEPGIPCGAFYKRTKAEKHKEDCGNYDDSHAYHVIEVPVNPRMQA